MSLFIGLVDGGESSETTALRELLEETGYTAVIKHCSPGMNIDLFSLFRGEKTPLSSSYNISGLVPVCWLLFQCI